VEPHPRTTTIVPRVSINPRRNLEAPLAEDSTRSRFERFLLLPYLVLVTVVALFAGFVVIAVLFALK
jgi:hypothetical protein